MIAPLTHRWFALLIVGFCLMSSTSFGEELKISVLDFCPLHCIGNNGEIDSNHPGVVVEIYQKIFGDAGYQTVFVVLPFNRGMAEVSEGRLNAISGPLQFSGAALQDKIRQWPRIGPLYARLIYPEQTIGTHHSSCFFIRSDFEWSYGGESSLENQRLGIANAHDYGPEMNAYIESALRGKNNHLIEKLSGQNLFLRNLKKLATNRVDISLIDRISGYHAIKIAEDTGEIPAGSVKLANCTGSAQNLYLGFSDQTPERSKHLARIFDEGIVGIRKSGELKHLLDKYGLKDWTESSVL